MANDFPVISTQWQRQIAILRELAQKAAIHADLVESVELQWQSRIEVQNGASEIRFLPRGDTLNHGRCLWVRAKARWTFELTSKEPRDMHVVLKRKVVPFERGDATLNELLRAMLEGRESKAVAQDTNTWDDIPSSFRRYSYAGQTKADLLESVKPKWTHVSEVNDNGQRVEIQRLGDTARDGVKLNIRIDGDHYLFDLQHHESTGRDDVLREAETTVADAPSLLDELLATMLSDRVEHSKTPHLTAQDVFKTMLRQQIAPALREMGFKGSGNTYKMSRNEYRIQIQLLRSKWSTRDSIQFDADVSVLHPPTIELFTETNRRARQQGKAIEHMEGGGGGFHGRLNSIAGRSALGFPWIIRPDESSEPVGDDFIEAVRNYFLPVIEEEVRRPLALPTPLDERVD